MISVQRSAPIPTGAARRSSSLPIEQRRIVAFTASALRAMNLVLDGIEARYALRRQRLCRNTACRRAKACRHSPCSMLARQ